MANHTHFGLPSILHDFCVFLVPVHDCLHETVGGGRATSSQQAGWARDPEWLEDLISLTTWINLEIETWLQQS